MTRRRWIADRVEGNRAWLTGDNADHLGRVLRAKPGQQFDIAVERVVRAGVVVSVAPDQVEFELGETVRIPALPEISVYLSIFKFDRLEWAIEKVTELGVARIVPMIARRTEAHLAKAAEKRVERWRKLALEAAQQSRRAASPEIVPPTSLKRAIANATRARIVLDENENARSLRSAVEACKPPVSLAFGPEGGWTSEEISLFQQSGWLGASLGETILRAETAAIAAVAVTMAVASENLTSDDTDSTDVH